MHACITLHYIALHYITLHYITLHYIHTYSSTYTIGVEVPFSRPHGRLTDLNGWKTTQNGIIKII